MAGAAAATLAGESLALAPLATPMLFSPSRPTKIRATPNRSPGCAQDVRRIDAVANELLDRAITENILADAGDHLHRTARPRRGDRLIGPLAAGGRGEFAAEHRLARPRNTIELDDHVRVATPDDDDARCFHSTFS